MHNGVSSRQNRRPLTESGERFDRALDHEELPVNDLQRAILVNVKIRG